MKRIFLAVLTGTLGGLLAVALLFLLFAPGFYKRSPRQEGGIIINDHRLNAFNVGEKFPDLNLKTVDGQQFLLSARPYKVLLVNFFSTW